MQKCVTQKAVRGHIQQLTNRVTKLTMSRQKSDAKSKLVGHGRQINGIRESNVMRYKSGIWQIVHNGAGSDTLGNKIQLRHITLIN